jgi:hypothetical protein
MDRQQTTQETYSEEQVKKIISAGGLNEDEGTIRQIIDSEKNILELVAYSPIRPMFIDNIDNDVWREQWQEKVKGTGIFYNGRDFSQRLGEVDYSKVIDFVNRVAELLPTHTKAINRYNLEIAEPYITERRKTLGSLL